LVCSNSSNGNGSSSSVICCFIVPAPSVTAAKRISSNFDVFRNILLSVQYFKMPNCLFKYTFVLPVSDSLVFSLLLSLCGAVAVSGHLTVKSAH
jgi:hypothetical protein